MANDTLPSSDDEQVIPIVAESVRIDKRWRETGKVRVALTTAVEERHVNETLREEAVEVERVPVGRELAAGEAPPQQRREADGTLVIPVLEEVLVVERRLVLREEVRVRVTGRSEAVTVPVALRRQNATVERLPAEAPVAPAREDGAAAPPADRS